MKRGSGQENTPFLKVLGGYDIALFSESPDFESQLTEHGPIEGILKFNPLLCFPYSWKGGSADTVSEMIKGIGNALFTGFILVKLREDPQKAATETEAEFFNLLTGFRPNSCYCLGTLGWNEIILILPDNEIENILADLTKRLLDESNLIVKSITYLTINYDRMFGSNWHQIDPDSNEALLQLTSTVKVNPALQTLLDSKLLPTIKISSAPALYRSIRESWGEGGYLARDCLGEDDILVEPNPKVLSSWGEFLGSLLQFRVKFSEGLHSTNTAISREWDGQNTSLIPMTAESPADCAIAVAEYNFEELKSYYGNEAKAVATQIYALSSMGQNPITGSAFQDMINYPSYILTFGRKYKTDSRKTAAFAAIIGELIGPGCELRSYGSYGHVEQKYGRYSKLKGGVLKALLGLEVYSVFHYKTAFAKKLVGLYQYIGAEIPTGKRSDFRPTECSLGSRSVVGPPA